MSQEEDLKRALQTQQQVEQLISLQDRVLRIVESLDEQVKTNDQESLRRDEENQRNINFILEQQAQFTADMQQMREAHERAEQKWESTADGIRALLAIAEIHDGEIKALAQTQAEAQARTDRQMSETDGRLNTLVNVVERLISERRNGGAGAG